jgi:hypothetical protein
MQYYKVALTDALLVISGRGGHISEFLHEGQAGTDYPGPIFGYDMVIKVTFA